jgi:gluconolactonase
VHPDGSVWFTDPSYGYLQGFRPEPKTGDFVYRLDPGSTTPVVMADSLDKPNGIAFSADGSVVYLADSGANQEPGSFHRDRPHHVYAFEIVDSHRLGRRTQLDVTTPGCPDGVTVDEAGRVYISCAAGVRVVSPRGELLGRINLPGAVNFTFGGRDRNRLFITTDTALWVAVLDTKGA